MLSLALGYDGQPDLRERLVPRAAPPSSASTCSSPASPASARPASCCASWVCPRAAAAAVEIRLPFPFLPTDHAMTSPTPLKFLMPGWFSLVMGLCGLSLAWHRGQRVFGDMADGVALVMAALAALVFVVLLVASVLRAVRYPAALAEDLRHPVRHAFVAAFPVSVLLLATVGVALVGPSAGLERVVVAGRADPALGHGVGAGALAGARHAGAGAGQHGAVAGGHARAADSGGGQRGGAAGGSAAWAHRVVGRADGHWCFFLAHRAGAGAGAAHGPQPAARPHPARLVHHAGAAGGDRHACWRSGRRRRCWCWRCGACRCSFCCGCCRSPSASRASRLV